MLLIIPAITFLAIVLVMVIWHAWARRGRGGVEARLREMVPDRPEQLPSYISASTRDAMPTVTRLISGRRLFDRLFTELSAAGVPIRPSEFIGIVAGCVVFFQFVAVLLMNNTLGYLAFGVVGLLLPMGVLKYLQAKRRSAFNMEIADALMMMSSSLRSGFSLLRSMQMVAQEMPPPISHEFQRVIAETNVGKQMEDALKSVAVRMKSYDFDLAVTAITIQLQVGGNLAEILQIIAQTIRERVRIVGEMQALTAEGRLSGVILFMLPIGMALVLVFLNRPYISTLIRVEFGHYLIGAAVVLQIIGGLIIRKLLTVDV